MIASDEFLKQCETEAFLKSYSCFSSEFSHLKNTYLSEKLLLLHLDGPKSIKWYTKQNLHIYWIQINSKTVNWSSEQVRIKVFYRYPFLGHTADIDKSQHRYDLRPDFLPVPDISELFKILWQFQIF